MRDRPVGPPLPLERMQPFLELKDIVFYLTFTALGLFLAHQSMESQRWRA